MIELPILGDKVEDTQTQEYFEEFNERYELRVYYYEEDNNFMIKILRIVSLGLFSLFEKWFVQVSLLSFQKSTDPSHLLIQKMKDGKRMSKDKIIKCKRDGDRIKFKYEYINFLITPQNQLKKLELINYDYNELSKYEAQQRQILYGENIMQIEECTRSQILFNEILSPFNIFQVFSFIVWTLDDYYLYAILIAILTIIQIAISLYDLEQQNHKIREMIYYENSVIVHRDHHQLKISSKDLVPGDIVQVTAKSMITFDGQLIQGEAVFNEAILTGESTPILKTINLEIFSGCSCLSASSDCRALVKSIGFNTVKGSLARYILFNNSYTYSFQKESLKYLLVLSFLGIILSIVNYFIRLKSTSDNFGSIIEALEIFTIMIPPSLPTALGAGLQVANQRLKANNIFCIKPDKINVSGMINFIGFDKTGTLTESTLKVLGCVEKKLLINPNHCKEIMQLALKSCHTLVGGCGDNLEIAMLECCQQKYDFEYQKVYQFEANLQRMTVIIQYKGKLLAITKGSPEIMERLCFQTIPDQFASTVNQYLQEGYRLISFGYKEIGSIDEERKYIENGLQYLGTLIFVNQLREDSKQLIELLNSINIKCVMVTGDNILTSINIAKQCQILDPNQPVITGQIVNDKLVFDNNINVEEIEQMNYQVALTGESWECVDKNMNIGTFTAFVGDGCNDICALQQSDIGLALSSQEASLAAPFLTPIIRVSQISEILKVGRSALITSQSCFKFMTLYSSIQTIALTICYISNTNLTVEQFLYQDLWIIIPIAFTMSLTKPSDILTIQQPFVSLLNRSIILSVVGLFCICCCSQLISFSTYDRSLITELNMEMANSINTQQIILANTQVIAVAIAYSQGKPFRQPIYRNYSLLFVLFIGMVVHILLIIKPNIINISVLCELTTNELMMTGLMNAAVFFVIILFENLCIKQYKNQGIGH